MAGLTPEAWHDRASRIPGWDRDRLARATVLIVGLGGLGCPAAEGLARSGVGRLILVDPDRVDPTNLARQTLFLPETVGQLKVEAGAEELRRRVPGVGIEARALRVGPGNVRSLVEGADLVVEGTDRFDAKFLVHDACLSAGVPLVQGAVHRWEAQVHRFAFEAGAPGCWRCLHPQGLDDAWAGTCAQEGVAPPAAALAGQALAAAALRHLLDLPGLDELTTWSWSAASWTPLATRWKPRAGCRCSGPQRRSWDWLSSAPGRTEARWADLAPRDRQVVVDLREPSEIGPGDRAWFEAAGSRYQSARWARWAEEEPRWEPDTTYLLVCAHGVRSRSAQGRVPPGIQALSLVGGTAGLASRMAQSLNPD